MFDVVRLFSGPPMSPETFCPKSEDRDESDSFSSSLTLSSLLRTCPFPELTVRAGMIRTGFCGISGAGLAGGFEASFRSSSSLKVSGRKSEFFDGEKFVCALSTFLVGVLSIEGRVGVFCIEGPFGVICAEVRVGVFCSSPGSRGVSHPEFWSSSESNCSEKSLLAASFKKVLTILFQSSQSLTEEGDAFRLIS